MKRCSGSCNASLRLGNCVLQVPRASDPMHRQECASARFDWNDTNRFQRDVAGYDLYDSPIFASRRLATILLSL
jgi:hypothetical protein